jgi:hypothetical protein
MRTYGEREVAGRGGMLQAVVEGAPAGARPGLAQQLPSGRCHLALPDRDA